MDGAPAVGDLLAQFLGEFGVKPDQHLVDDVQGILGGGEFIGVRVQIALQPVVVAQGQVLEEGEGVVVVGRHVVELVHGGNPFLLQKLEDLLVAQDCGVAPLYYSDKHYYYQNWVKDFYTSSFGASQELYRASVQK